MPADITCGRFEYHRPTPPPPEPTIVFSRIFDGRPGVPHSALDAAHAFLVARGFSYGPGCAASRRAGILFGAWRIAKWRNLTPLEQRQ